MLKVSVIIPIYNVEQYLKECLESVINQTLKDIEIICVNDGSTDNSLKIIEEYASIDNRIKFIDQKNSGAGVARNAGLSIANGEYLAFLDGDDFYHLCFLDKMYNKAKNTDSDIVICEVNSYNISSKNIEKINGALKTDNIPKSEVFSGYDMKDNIFNSFQNWNWNKLYKKSFIDKNEIIFQELRRTNDLLFTCSALALAERISVLKECLVYYRIGGLSNSQSTNHLYPTDFYKAFIGLKEFLINKNLYKVFSKSYKKHFYSGILYNLNSIKDPKVKDELHEFLKCEFKKQQLNLDKELKIFDRQRRKQRFFKKIFHKLTNFFK